MSDPTKPTPDWDAVRQRIAKLRAERGIEASTDDIENYLRSLAGEAPRSAISGGVQNIQDFGRQTAKGAVRSYTATAAGLAKAIPDALLPEGSRLRNEGIEKARQSRVAELDEIWGESEGLSGTLGGFAGALLGEGSQAVAAGGILAKGAKAARAVTAGRGATRANRVAKRADRALNADNLKGRFLRNAAGAAAVDAPIAAAGADEGAVNNLARLLAEDNRFSDTLDKNTALRILADVGFGTVAGTTLETVIDAARAMRRNRKAKKGESKQEEQAPEAESRVQGVEQYDRPIGPEPLPEGPVGPHVVPEDPKKGITRVTNQRHAQEPSVLDLYPEFNYRGGADLEDPSEVLQGARGVPDRRRLVDATQERNRINERLAKRGKKGPSKEERATLRLQKEELDGEIADLEATSPEVSEMYRSAIGPEPKARTTEQYDQPLGPEVGENYIPDPGFLRDIDRAAQPLALPRGQDLSHLPEGWEGSPTLQNSKLDWSEMGSPVDEGLLERIRLEREIASQPEAMQVDPEVGVPRGNRGPAMRDPRAHGPAIPMGRPDPLEELLRRMEGVDPETEALLRDRLAARLLRERTGRPFLSELDEPLEEMGPQLGPDIDWQSYRAGLGDDPPMERGNLLPPAQEGRIIPFRQEGDPEIGAAMMGPEFRGHAAVQRGPGEVPVDEVAAGAGSAARSNPTGLEHIHESILGALVKQGRQADATRPELVNAGMRAEMELLRRERTRGVADVLDRLGQPSGGVRGLLPAGASKGKPKKGRGKKKAQEPIGPEQGPQAIQTMDTSGLRGLISRNTRPGEGQWRFSTLDEEGMPVQPHQSFGSLDEAVAAAEAQGHRPRSPDTPEEQIDVPGATSRGEDFLNEGSTGNSFLAGLEDEMVQTPPRAQRSLPQLPREGKTSQRDPEYAIQTRPDERSVRLRQQREKVQGMTDRDLVVEYFNKLRSAVRVEADEATGGPRGNVKQANSRLAAVREEMNARGLPVPPPEDAYRFVESRDLPADIRPKLDEVRDLPDEELMARAEAPHGRDRLAMEEWWMARGEAKNRHLLPLDDADERFSLRGGYDPPARSMGQYENSAAVGPHPATPGGEQFSVRRGGQQQAGPPPEFARPLEEIAAEQGVERIDKQGVTLNGQKLYGSNAVSAHRRMVQDAVRDGQLAPERALELYDDLEMPLGIRNPATQMAVMDGGAGDNVASMLRAHPTGVPGSPGFYSRLERAVAEAPQEKGTPEQWKGWLSKNVAKGEREWMGLDEWLQGRGKTVTRGEVAQFIQQNRIELGEVQLGGHSYEEWERLNKQKGEASSGEYASLEERQQLEDQLVDDLVDEGLFPASAREMAEDTPVKATDVRYAIRDFAIEHMESVKGLPREEAAARARQAVEPLVSDMTEDFFARNPDATDEVIQKVAQDARMRLLRYLAKWRDVYRYREKAEAASQALRELKGVNTEGTRYKSWTLPGGSNYREVLVTLKQPVTKDPPMREQWQLLDDEGNPVAVGDLVTTNRWLARGEDPTRIRRVEVVDRQAVQRDDAFGYHSGHWDEPNVLVHLRLKDRTDVATGERVLFVEEIQSDWHQQGRDKGYGGPNPEAVRAAQETHDARKAEFDALIEQERALTERMNLRQPVLFQQMGVRSYAEDILGNPERRAELERLREADPVYGKAMQEHKKVRELTQRAARRVYEAQQAVRAAENPESVPDAPYKNTDEWVGLAVRRVLDEFSRGEYDKIAWATGKQNADRYSLRKQADEMYYNPETGQFYAEKNGMRVHAGNYDPKALSSVIGKEAADRLLATEPVASLSGMKQHALKGDDLEFGGEGMITFYNRIVPKAFATELKKLGIKVEPLNTPVDGVADRVGGMTEDWAPAIQRALARSDLDEQTLKAIRRASGVPGNPIQFLDGRIGAARSGMLHQDPAPLERAKTVLNEEFIGDRPGQPSFRPPPELKQKIQQDGLYLYAGLPRLEEMKRAFASRLGQMAVGAAVGGAVDGSDGDSPVEGMLIGAGVVGGARALVKLSTPAREKLTQRAAELLGKGESHVAVSKKNLRRAERAVTKAGSAPNVSRPDQAPNISRMRDGSGPKPPMPRAPALPLNGDPTTKPELYARLDKIIKDPDGQNALAEMMARMKERDNQNPGSEPLLSKERISWEDVRRIAAEIGLDPNDVVRLGAKKANLSGAELLAIRELINERLQDIATIDKVLADHEAGIKVLSGMEYNAAKRAGSLYEGQLTNLIQNFNLARSQKGRDLNSLKIAAHHSMDPATWVARASRMLAEHDRMLSGAQRDEIMRLAREGTKEELAKYVADMQPNTPAEKFVTVWKAGLLTGPTTHFANGLGNSTMLGLESVKDAPAVFFDFLLSKYLHTDRTKDLSLGSYTRAARDGAVAGWKHAKKVMETGVDMTSSSAHKWDQYREVTFENPILNAYTKTVFRALSAADKPFKLIAMQRSLWEQARVKAKNQGFVGEEFDAKVEEFYTKPDMEMIINSFEAAEYAIFADNSRLAKAASGLRRGFGDGWIGAAVDTAIPFTRVPANIATRVLEYSPLGFLNGAKDFVTLMKLATNGDASEVARLQRKTVEQLGRSSIGATAIITGYYLAERGLTSGSMPQGSERDQMYLEGRTPNSVLVGNRWMGVERISPMGNLLLLGAALHDLKNDPEFVAEEGRKRSVGEVALGGVASIGKTITEQSYMQGMNLALDALSEEHKANAFAKNLAGSVVPNIVRQASNVADPVMRNTDGEGLAEEMVNSVQNRVPGLKDNLPARIDQFGRPVPREGGLKEMLDPFRSSVDERSKSEVIAELSRVNATLPARKQKEGETLEQYTERAAQEGQEAYRLIQYVIQSPGYEAAPHAARELVKWHPDYRGRSVQQVAAELQAKQIEGALSTVRSRARQRQKMLQGAGQ